MYIINLILFTTILHTFNEKGSSEKNEDKTVHIFDILPEYIIY